MKGDQSNWSKFSLGKEDREKQNPKCEDKSINRDFALLVKTQ
jgi:hypothetical protein